MSRFRAFLARELGNESAFPEHAGPVVDRLANAQTDEARIGELRELVAAYSLIPGAYAQRRREGFEHQLCVLLARREMAA